MELTEAILGKKGVYSRTVAESDVYLFGGITGDLHFNHFNEEFMKTTEYGTRMAHGILILGMMSTAGARLNEREGWTTVSYGYDRIRFIRPVLIGDTISAEYKVVRIDPENQKYYAEVTCKNQHGTLVCVATHVAKFYDAYEDR
jgi:3-hydroxybutyryl-CoA dehydratase